MWVNLLRETERALHESGKEVLDVSFVSGEGPWWTTWAVFEQWASTFDYEKPGTGDSVPYLFIVGRDWWLERLRYEGSEWWEFRTVPTRPFGRPRSPRCFDEALQPMNEGDYEGDGFGVGDDAADYINDDARYDAADYMAARDLQGLAADTSDDAATAHVAGVGSEPEVTSLLRTEL